METTKAELLHAAFWLLYIYKYYGFIKKALLAGDSIFYLLKIHRVLSTCMYIMGIPQDQYFCSSQYIFHWRKVIRTEEQEAAFVSY